MKAELFLEYNNVSIQIQWDCLQWIQSSCLQHFSSFFHHQILAIYALNLSYFPSKKLHCPMNGQKFALLLPKSFVKSKIAFMVQTCHFCVYESLKKMQFNCWMNFTTFFQILYLSHNGTIFKVFFDSFHHTIIILQQWLMSTSSSIGFKFTLYIQHTCRHIPRKKFIFPSDYFLAACLFELSFRLGGKLSMRKI